MGIEAPGIGIGYDLHEALKLGTAVVQHKACGILHEAVGKDNPQGRDVARNKDKPGTDAVGLRAQLLPAKMPYGKKGGFHEEGNGGLYGQQGPEDIAHVFGVARPVGAKLKFQGDACDNAQREIDEEKLSPEFCVFKPDFVMRPDVFCLHPGNEKRQSQSERNEDKMEKDSYSKLQP